MTIRLRAHHLLCLLSYAGKGYSPAFVANFDAIAARLDAGEDILLTEGPDDICAPLLRDPSPHCTRASVRTRDQRAAHDIGLFLGQPVTAGSRIIPTAALLRRMRSGFAGGQTRAACRGCEWSDLCTSLADDGFSLARISGAER